MAVFYHLNRIILDQYRSKINRGQFREDCNGFDDRLAKNGVKGFYVLKHKREPSVKEEPVSVQVCNTVPDDKVSVASKCEEPKETKKVFKKDNSWFLELKEFVNAIIFNKKILHGAYLDAVNVMKLINKIYNSKRYKWS